MSGPPSIHFWSLACLAGGFPYHPLQSPELIMVTKYLFVPGPSEGLGTWFSPEFLCKNLNVLD